MNFYEESRKFALEHVEPYAKRSDEEGRFPVESFELFAYGSMCSNANFLDSS